MNSIWSDDVRLPQFPALTEDKKTIIYVDMDGVIASYDFGKPLDFKNKRPLTTNIKTLSQLCNLKNV